jgi:hypothetical protein
VGSLELKEVAAEYRVPPETGTLAEWQAEFEAAAQRSLVSRYRVSVPSANTG